MPRTRTLFATAEDAETAFFEALEQANLDALMELWSEDDEIVCVHPGGPRLVGHAAVRSGWKALFANGPVHARPAQLQVATGPMVSIHSLIEQVMVTHHGKHAVVNVFATNIYFKSPQGWRLVLHHASLAPQETPLSTLTASSLLH
jgi:ketosteroid isomerase-like protein